MQTILHNCCGMDVHKDSVVACILKTRTPLSAECTKDAVEKEIRIFGTFPDDLTQLRTWLESEGCRHAAMESTGVFWQPIYEALEDALNGEIELKWSMCST